MPVDPNIQNVLDLMNQPGRPAISDGDPATARQLFDAMTAMLSAASPDGPRVPVGEVTDSEIAGVPVRVYRPEGASGPVPTTVFFHGGGFVIGNIASHDDTCRMITVGTSGVVVSVDYRLAPEAPYPAGPDDCEAVTREVLEHVDQYGGDPERVGIGGDSAGGNIAAVLSQRFAARPGAHPVKAQLLWYPAVDMVDSDDTRAAYPSREQNKEGYFLTEADMVWFGGHYLGDTDRTAADVSPLRGQLEGLPPAVVATAEYDPLRDEGNAYAEALEKAGVTVRATQHDGLIHGYAGMVVLSPAAIAAAEQDIAAYRELLTS